jgi:prolyl 4-hydroxylase
VVAGVLEKMEALTQIHRNYTETLQLLRYEPGQFYEEHHDYIELDRERLQGPRILTVFLYLNTVEEGGGTNFPALDLTIQPKQGRVVIWPSVLDENPSDKDFRTNHQALPVIKGIKYGANEWIHLRHFRQGYAMGC